MLDFERIRLGDLLELDASTLRKPLRDRVLLRAETAAGGDAKVWLLSKKLGRLRILVP